MSPNKLNYIFTTLLFLTSACSYKINSSIQKSENLVSKSNCAIFYLKPKVTLIRLDGYKKDDYYLIEKSENEITQNIHKLSKKFKVNSTFQISNQIKDSTYLFNNLARRINITAQSQQNIFNQISRKDEDKLVQQLFSIEPNIGYEYANLAQQLKTELVGLVGVIALDLKSKESEIPDIAYYLPNKGYIQYHYIVNVITGKIIYQEVRVFDSWIKPEHLLITLYDSFYLLHKNLNP